MNGILQIVGRAMPGMVGTPTLRALLNPKKLTIFTITQLVGNTK